MHDIECKVYFFFTIEFEAFKTFFRFTQIYINAFKSLGQLQQQVKSSKLCI